LRLHVFGTISLRARDLDNVRLTLGSDNGLRGYAPRALQGNNLYRVNVELRSLAINLWTIHVGGVVFYDGGDAPAGLNRYDASGNFLAAGFHQDAGLGLRVLFPQFNREVMRLDLGFPFEMPASGGYVPRFSVEFAQAF
jgi:hemolysin activation/secretion protein